MLLQILSFVTRPLKTLKIEWKIADSTAGRVGKPLELAHCLFSILAYNKKKSVCRGNHKMEDVKQTIADNITELRKGMHLTQAELADKMGYTDKAISKWERAESIPDVVTLKEFAELSGVTLDYLVAKEHAENRATLSKQARGNRVVISLLAAAAVWLIATVLFVYLQILGVADVWKVFVGAVPITMIVLLVFNSIWGNTKLNYVIISVLVWSALAFTYLMLMQYNLFLIFLIGIPIQVMVILWSKIKTYKT
jgi:transcriptional regulator with XRE-family HTH domain